MLSPNVSRADVALEEGLLSCGQCLAPCWVGLVSPRGDFDEVPYWSAEDAHGRRNLRLKVGRVVVVQYRPLHRIRVQSTFWTWKATDARRWRTPHLEEESGFGGSELRPPVRSQFFRRPIRGESLAQVAYEVCGATH